MDRIIFFNLLNTTKYYIFLSIKKQAVLEGFIGDVGEFYESLKTTGLISAHE